MLKASPRRLAVIGLVTVIIAAFPAAASASHSWGSYHWARTSNPFTLKVVDSATQAWDNYLNTSIADWSQSTVLDLSKTNGTVAKGKTCKTISGQVNVCNSKYGNNGWLGVASIWAQGDHITQGTVKLNDTYFDTASYNTPAWRNLVMCQEIGHTLGLDHQDATFGNPNLGTCMDYTSDPDGPPSNEHPNSHDLGQLVTIYSHLDSPTTVGQVAADGSAAPGWGRMIRDNGHNALFARDLGSGMVVFSFVIWAR
ncbi:MAG: hypothetical protein ABIQ05_05910 [Candidatus Limnocylindria bacterium]